MRRLSKKTAALLLSPLALVAFYWLFLVIAYGGLGGRFRSVISALAFSFSIYPLALIGLWVALAANKYLPQNQKVRWAVLPICAVGVATLTAFALNQILGHSGTNYLGLFAILLPGFFCVFGVYFSLCGSRKGAAFGD